MKHKRMPPVFFFAFANDRNVPENKLKELALEADQLKADMEIAKIGAYFDYHVCVGATLEMIRKELNLLKAQGREVQVFYYGGHAEKTFLLLEGKVEGNDWVGDRGLLQLWCELGSLRLVFLNGCNSGAMCERMQYQMRLTCFIGTTANVSDSKARPFARSFFQSLLFNPSMHVTIKKAFSAAWEVLHTDLKFRIKEDEQPYRTYWDPVCPTQNVWSVQPR